METREGERGNQYQEVIHEYYEKEMVAPRVIGKDSALPSKVKITTLTQEIIRICKNTSRSIRDKVRGKQMTRFSMKLMLSGYNKKERREILVAELKGFKRLENLEKEGKRSLNRNRRENYEARLLKKHNAKSNWYKGKKSTEEDSRSKKREGPRKKKSTTEIERTVEAVLFVPATPEGVLAKMIQEEDDKLREGTGERRIKVVERGGESLREKLCRNNP